MADQFRETFTQALLDAIADTQRRSGREVQPMTEDTIPLLDLAGFDSHNGVEVEVLLSIRLGVEIEKVAFCAGKRGSKELKVREIVSALVSKYGHKYSDSLGKKTEELVIH
jgi:hypothetical protein